jgi:hypothetical protein
MTQKIKKIAGLLMLELGLAFALVGNNSGLLFALDKATTTTFSEKGTIFPSIIHEGEYILAGTWNMDVNNGKVTNFTGDIQVELCNGSNPHTHQFVNFRQAPDEVFELDANKDGEVRGTIDIGLNNNIAHRNVTTNIIIDRGVVLSITPDLVGSRIHGLSTNPTIYGLIESSG